MKELFYDSTLQKFNGAWEFLSPSGEKSAVELPHGWNTIGWSYEADQNLAPSGTGVYTKKAGDELKSGDVLKFEGVSAQAKVFLDGTLLAENKGAHRAFEVVLPALTPESELRIEVTDKESMAPLAEGQDPDFAQSPRYALWPVAKGSSLKAGGIWRDVWRARRPSSWLATPEVRPSGTAFYADFELNGNAENFSIRCTLSDDSSSISATVPAARKTLRLEPENPVLSWPLHPHLYQWKTELLDAAGEVVQTILQPVMLMRLEVRDSGFRLNGKPYFLRGQNGFAHCNVHYDREYIEQYVSAYRAQGVEISRFHTEPPAHAWLDECDRQGIMVILEMPIHGSYACYSFGSKEFENNELPEILSIVKEYRRHPSVAIWSMGNELIVACERDRGLMKPLFKILDRWIGEVRKLDERPVISNSNGDGANLTRQSVGDIDDVHQYGGWYTENIRDLRHFGEYTRKNDMLFQPCISTESIAGYTNDKGEFFCKHSDVRQQKIVALRFGKITDLARQAQDYQSFLLKEYSEAMWRLRNPESSFSGYIPFGQYTWFRKPFGKGKDALVPKMIWDTYRQVLGPVHVQLECFSRHVFARNTLKATLRVYHENIHLPETCAFSIRISCEGAVLAERTCTIRYHESFAEELELPLPFANGPHTLKQEVSADGKTVAENTLAVRIYPAVTFAESKRRRIVYDPDNRLASISGERIDDPAKIVNYDPAATCLFAGPYALGADARRAAPAVGEWLRRGGHAVVLEQNPGTQGADNIFDTGIGTVKACQPQWSRWAMNLVKHADRADLTAAGHPFFDGVTESDLSWWNPETFTAHSYLVRGGDDSRDVILSRIGNGLEENELMPIEYEFRDSGYSVIALERPFGAGRIIASSLLLGSLWRIEPVAAHLLNNLLKME